MKYIVYCRRSTNQQNKQEQSIILQLKELKNYIETNELFLCNIPDYENILEIELELQKEVEKFPQYKDIIDFYAGKYVVIERETAHTPGQRDKWNQIMKFAHQRNKGVDGIISVAPDRHARNMLEAGKLLDAVDKGVVDVKYSTFAFENNASGKMMLTVLFGFAKHYSDKRSEHTYKGFITSINRGNALGLTKYGYKINDEGKLEPDGKNFELMEYAFTLKVYQSKSDIEIINYLKENGFRVYKHVGKGNEDFGKVGGVYKELPKNMKTLKNIRTDSFYYGVFKYGDETIDYMTTDVNKEYRPLISKDEYDILNDHYSGSNKQQISRAKKEELGKCYPFPSGMIIDASGKLAKCYIPTKTQKRLRRELEKSESNELYQVVKLSDIRYESPKITVTNNDGSEKKISIKAEVLCEKVHKQLKQLKIDENMFDKFRAYALMKMKEKSKSEVARNAQLVGRKNMLIQERDKLIERKLRDGKSRSTEEKQVYENKLHDISYSISKIDEDIQKTSSQNRNKAFESMYIFEVLQHLPLFYQKASTVRKARIAGIFFSNLVFSANNSIEIRLKQDWKYFFSSMVTDTGLEPVTSAMSMQRSRQLS